MKTPFAIFLLLLAAGCANRQPTSGEVRVQSRLDAGFASASTPSAPFCLHIRYANDFQFVLSQNDAQAWVTDGSCESNGPRRIVADLSVRWRYRNDNPGNKSCAAADSCAISEKTPGEGRVLSCVAGSARDGAWVAVASTDVYSCP